MKNAIRTERLTRHYKLPKGQTKTALTNLDLCVAEGEIFGFLGANGAGKTTTIKLLLDFIRPTSGQSWLLDIPSTQPEARARIGYLPEQPFFHRFLTVTELLTAHAQLADIPAGQVKAAVKRAIAAVGMEEYAQTRLSKLSKGLTQIVALAQAMVGQPQLLILDEPSSGLDPINRRQMSLILKALREQGCTVFLSSHHLSEVETLCTQVAILKHGELVAQGTPESLAQGGSMLTITTSLQPDQQQSLEQMPGVRCIANEGLVEVSIALEQFYELTTRLAELKAPVIQVNSARESLEQIFLRYSQ
ncbi:MAG: ABC transporter ATP-binding protein [Armatimonadota bacterium]